MHGVPCVWGPLKAGDKDGSLEDAGTTCTSYELGFLTVHSDSRLTRINGETLHIVVELTGIQIDLDPDPEWFGIPPDFSLRQ